jgi:hypothetical protein
MTTESELDRIEKRLRDAVSDYLLALWPDIANDPEAIRMTCREVVNRIERDIVFWESLSRMVAR